MKGKELVRGRGVFPGKAVGLVRIIGTHEGPDGLTYSNQADNDAFKPGEVYVHPHPGPDDDPAMHKACAIVTNSGGPTTHAAIVARPWKLPCVVGTVTATMVLQSGQHVLVDGNAGLDERGRPIGIVYEWIPGPGEIPPSAISAEASGIPTAVNKMKAKKPAGGKGPSEFDKLLAQLDEELKKTLPEEALELPEKVVTDKIVRGSPPVEWVYKELSAIAQGVDYGRGKHANVVTSYLLKMYDDMVSIGCVKHTKDKRRLYQIAGLSHDIGVRSERRGEEHHEAGLRIARELLWTEKLPPDRKAALGLVLYAIFYHKPPIPAGKFATLKNIPLEDYQTCSELVALLRVADGLDFGLPKGSPHIFEKVEMARTPLGIECRVTPKPSRKPDTQLQKAREKSEVFEATFGRLSFWIAGGGGTSWHLWGHAAQFL